jgi:hypothetical protein
MAVLTLHHKAQLNINVTHQFNLLTLSKELPTQDHSNHILRRLDSLTLIVFTMLLLLLKPKLNVLLMMLQLAVNGSPRFIQLQVLFQLLAHSPQTSLLTLRQLLLNQIVEQIQN